MAEIKTEEEYQDLLIKIDQLMDKVDEDTPSTNPSSNELDILTGLVEEYEAAHYSLETPSLQGYVDSADG